MGKEVRGVPEAPPLSPEARDPELAIGAYLSRQRRLRGISLDELSDLTRIPRRSLERLEGGAFDTQADGFARGFVRSVALALGLDADEAVSRLLGEPPEEDEEQGAGQALRARWLAAAAVASLLLLLGLAAWGLRALWGGLPEAPSPAPLQLRRDAVRALADSLEAEAADARPPPAEAPGRSPEPARRGEP